MPYTKHKQLLHEFSTCIKEKNYFSAHEKLEEIWYPRRYENNNEIKLLKGFINAAVCFELIKKGRHTPSNMAWKNYLKYRTLLYKIHSPFLNEYHKLSRELEQLKYHKKI